MEWIKKKNRMKQDGSERKNEPNGETKPNGKTKKRETNKLSKKAIKKTPN